MTLLFLMGRHTLKNAADAYGIPLTTHVRVLTHVVMVVHGPRRSPHTTALNPLTLPPTL